MLIFQDLYIGRITDFSPLFCVQLKHPEFLRSLHPRFHERIQHLFHKYRLSWILHPVSWKCWSSLHGMVRLLTFLIHHHCQSLQMPYHCLLHLRSVWFPMFLLLILVVYIQKHPHLLQHKILKFHQLLLCSIHDSLINLLLILQTVMDVLHQHYLNLLEERIPESFLDFSSLLCIHVLILKYMRSHSLLHFLK